VSLVGSGLALLQASHSVVRVKATLYFVNNLRFVCGIVSVGKWEPTHKFTRVVGLEEEKTKLKTKLFKNMRF